MDEIKVFSPATVANLSCGFDVLGCCLDNVGDEMTFRKNNLKELRITKITGQELPFEIEKNVAGVAVKTMLEVLGEKQGFDIEIDKKIRVGSGIGSSAASAAGAVFAINLLLNDPFTAKQLIPFAMAGEQLASGNAHADNVAPALLGGFCLVRSYEPLEVINLPSPQELRMVILHPLIEIKTQDSRSILRHTVSLKKAVDQWGNLGALVSALYTNDYDLLGRSIQDGIIEPIRSILIPYFEDIRQVALKNGALGCGISGSGPSIFALCGGDESAEKVRDGIRKFYDSTLIAFDLHLSKINSEGVKVL